MINPRIMRREEIETNMPTQHVDIYARISACKCKDFLHSHASTSLIIPSKDFRAALGFVLYNTLTSRCCMLYFKSSNRCFLGSAEPLICWEHSSYAFTKSYLQLCQQDDLSLNICRHLPLYSTSFQPPYRYPSRHVICLHIATVLLLPGVAAASNAVHLLASNGQ